MSIGVNAQKQDYVWLFGKDQISADPGVQASQFNFNNFPFEPEIRNGGLEFGTNNSSICDSDGNLLLYSNGCAIANGSHEVVLNGDSINYGVFFQELWLDDCGNGYSGIQDLIWLNDPGNDHGFFLIHKTIEFDQQQDPATFRNLLKYSYVDLTLNNGKGEVVQKNVVFHEELILGSFLTAINHENGRDWWIIQPTVNGNNYLVFLLTDQGINLVNKQSIGPSFLPIWTSSSGTAKFSPDGNSYAIHSGYNGLFLFDFDRTTGVLSNYRGLSPSYIPDVAEFSSVEFSPNSRFLYLCHADTLRQVDTWENDLSDGVLFIDSWNGLSDPNPGFFNVSALGPDCRIYIRMFSSTNSFHVIHEPDMKGLACDFEQQAIQLPLISAAGSFPNHPRWRVDEIDKCDTSLVSMFNEPVYYTRDLTIFFVKLVAQIAIIIC